MGYIGLPEKCSECETNLLFDTETDEYKCSGCNITWIEEQTIEIGSAPIEVKNLYCDMISGDVIMEVFPNKIFTLKNVNSGDEVQLTFSDFVKISHALRPFFTGGRTR